MNFSMTEYLLISKLRMNQLLSKRLNQIPGLYSFNVAYVALPTLEDIIQIAVQVLDKEIENEMEHIKNRNKKT